jgi:Fe-coproporphyrin III synthase
MRNTLRPQSNPSALLKAALRTTRYHALDWLGMLKPLKLRIGLTNRCNAKCMMCNIWKMVDNTAPFLPEELSVEEIDTILTRNTRFLSNLNHISLTGGEPTLRRDFVDIWRVLHRHFPDTGMSFNSNGFSTQKLMGFVDEILRFHERLTVMISLDGFGENHDRVRGMRNVFPHVLKSLESLVQLREGQPWMKVELNYVLTPLNVDDCLEVYRWCKASRVSFNPIYAIQGELYDNEDDDNVSLTQDARRHYVEHFTRILADDDSLQTREILDQLVDRPRDFDCWAGRTMFLIEENGRVFPNGGCPSDFALGNLRDFDYSFEALLAGDQARRVLAGTNKCRLCRLSCETMTTLQHPEALAGYRKSREMPVEMSDEVEPITGPPRKVVAGVQLPAASRQEAGVGG